MPLSGPHPQLGDLIEFIHLGYEHWGVYVGDGYVVHLTAPIGVTSLTSSSNTSAVVKKERLNIAANGDTFRVNNKYDKKRKPYAPEKIVQAVLKLVGQTMSYDLIENNCEHFATQLRYGKSFSDQVFNLIVGVGGIVLVILLLFLKDWQ